MSPIAQSSTLLGPFYRRPLWRWAAQVIWLIVLVIALVLLFNAGNSSSDLFFSERNVVSMVQQLLPLLFMALPMALIMAAGGLDLSVGAVASLVAIVVARQLEAGVGLSTAILLGLLVGLAAGLVNGLLVGVFRLHGALVTLGTMTLARAIGLAISAGRALTVTDSNATEYLSILTEPGGSLLWLILLGVLVLLLAEFTPLGRRPIPWPGAGILGFLGRVVVVTLPYVLSGLAAAFVGLLLLGRLHTATSTAASGYEVQAILAVVIGGTVLGGGLCHAIGAVLGGVFVVVITNLVMLGRLETWMTSFCQGAILLVGGAITHVYYLVFAWLYRRQAVSAGAADGDDF